jgi:hypothetical protein
LRETKLMEDLKNTQKVRTASKPPNAPDTEAAEKKSAARRPNSDRLYQLNNAEFNCRINELLEQTTRDSSSLRGTAPPRIRPKAILRLDGLSRTCRMESGCDESYRGADRSFQRGLGRSGKIIKRAQGERM